MDKIQIGKTLIEYDAGNIRIVDSYKIKKKQDMIEILMNFKSQTNFKSKRTIKSWIKEWKSHNLMYKLNLFKNHTKDCDLEENEKLYRRIIYWIIGNI